VAVRVPVRQWWWHVVGRGGVGRGGVGQDVVHWVAGKRKRELDR
jgi:hypothetical protein